MELRHPVDLDPVQETAGARVDRRHLVLDLPGLQLILVERLDQALAAGQRGLRVGVQLGAELREGLQLAVLREVQAQLAGHLLHRLGLRVAAHPGHRDAHVDRRPHARAEQVALQEDLAVGDRDDVGRHVGRHVARLGLDDRQRGERPATKVVVELHRSLQQARVQVEDVARVGLTARRAAQQQRHLPVRVGVLGQVVVDAQRVLAVVEEVLAHGAARVGGHELDRRGLVGRRGDDDRRVQRPVLLERLGHAHDRRHALPDGHVDRDQVGLGVVDDGVDRDLRLAGLAVADDQLALTAPDGGHGVDGLQSGEHRLLDGLALHHAGRLELGGAGALELDVSLAVQRLAERVDDAAEQPLAHRDLEQAPGPLDRVALLDLVPVAEQHGADVVGLEVEREPRHVVGELEHLERHAVVQAVHARDAVGDGQHGADLGEVASVAVVESLDAALEDAGDLVWLDLHGLGFSF